MRTSIIIACLIIYGFHNSVEAQSPLPLNSKPSKSEITLYSSPDNMIGVLYLLKDSSIFVSSSLVKEDYNNGNYEVAELYIDDINLISSRRPLGTATQAVLGAIVGAGVGVLTARIVEGPPPYPESTIGPGSEFAYAFLGSVGAVGGAVTGIIIGSIKVKIPINGSMENYNRNKKKLGRFTIKYPGAPKY
jgi:hypothetical protein